MNVHRYAVGLLAAALIAAPIASPAQDADSGDPLSDVWLVTPKQGMNRQFEQAVKAHIAFRSDAGDSRNWQSYQAAVGADPTVYQFRGNGLDWADQDAYVEEDRENGYSAHWFENVDEYVEQYDHFLERSDMANSHWPEDMEQHPYYGVTTWTLEPAPGPDMRAAQEELSRIAKEDGWAAAGNNWLWLERIGGEPTLMVVTEFDSYADMAPPEQDFFAFVSEQIGAEEAGELFERFTSALADAHYTVWAHRPDLSAEEMASSND